MVVCDHFNVFWRSQQTSHDRHVCVSSDKFSLLHKLDFAHGNLLSAVDWRHHCGDVHRLWSKIINFINMQKQLQMITACFISKQNQSEESLMSLCRMDGGLSESCSALLLWRQSWQILAWPYTSGESFSVCPAQGSGWQRARGDWNCVWFSCLKLRGQHSPPIPEFFGSCCKGALVFGIYRCMMS